MCSLLVISSLGVIHCSDLGTTTILDPEGAPEIKQVFVEERVSCTPRGKKQRSQMAFGSHPDIPYPTKDSDGNYEDLCAHIDTQFVDDRVVTNAICDRCFFPRGVQITRSSTKTCLISGAPSGSNMVVVPRSLQ